MKTKVPNKARVHRKANAYKICEVERHGRTSVSSCFAGTDMELALSKSCLQQKSENDGRDDNGDREKRERDRQRQKSGVMCVCVRACVRACVCVCVCVCVHVCDYACG